MKWMQQSSMHWDLEPWVMPNLTFCPPLRNENFTAYSGVSVVLLSDLLSQCPCVRPVLSSVHSRGPWCRHVVGHGLVCLPLQHPVVGYRGHSPCPGWQYHNLSVGLPAWSFIYIGISLSLIPNLDTKHVLRWRMKDLGAFLLRLGWGIKLLGRVTAWLLQTLPPGGS